MERLKIELPSYLPRRESGGYEEISKKTGIMLYEDDGLFKSLL
jgi:hypothetical protein